MMGFARGRTNGGVGEEENFYEHSEHVQGRGDGFLPRNDGLGGQMDSTVIVHERVGVGVY